MDKKSASQPAANPSQALSLEELLKKNNMVKEEDQKKEKAKAQAEAEEDDVERVERQGQFDLENNPFYTTLYNKQLTIEEKKEQIAALMTYDENMDVDQNEVRQQQYELFKAFLMTWRKDMALDIIGLTDPETYAELHKMYKQINSAMLQYRKELTPLLDIIDASNTILNAPGEDMMLKVYESFEEDDKAKAEYDKALKEAQDQVDKNFKTYKDNERRMAALDQTTNLFGKVKKSARLEKSQLEIDQKELLLKLSEQKPALEQLLANPPQEQFPQLREAKAKMRELLEIDSSEHRQRVVDLINTAERFVNTTDVRGHEVLDHYLRRRDHVGTLDKANSSLDDIYAVLSDATKTALTKNDDIFKKHAAVPEEEEFTDKLLRERTLNGVANYITVAKRSQQDTEDVRGQLVAQKLVLTTAKTNNDDQINDAYGLVGSTNAQVAEGLATALDAVTAAATDMARLIAQETNRVMRKDNNKVIKNEVDRIANNAGQGAEKLKEASAMIAGLLAMTEDSIKKTQAGEARTAAELVNYDALREKMSTAVQDLISTAAKGSNKEAFNGKAAPEAPPPAPANDDKAPAAPKPGKKSALEGNPLLNMESAPSKPAPKKAEPKPT
jgi:hypothetical protein